MASSDDEENGGSIDPSVRNLLGGLRNANKPLREKSEAELEAEVEAIKAEKKRRKAKKMQAPYLVFRAAYDMPPGMKEIITALANEYQTTNSQIASFLLAHAINAYREGVIEIEPSLVPSRSPRRPHNVEIPEFRDPSDTF